MKPSMANIPLDSPDVVNPEITGLDQQFDQIIRSIPASIITAADDYLLEESFSRDPMTTLKGIRDRSGYIARGDNGVFAGVQLPNNFGIDYKLPHFVMFGVEEIDQLVMDDKAFRNRNAYGQLGDAMKLAHGEVKGTIPTIEDGEVHDELRAIYDSILNPSRMSQRTGSLIRPIGDWLIDRIQEKLERGEEACLCRDLAIPLTYKAMSAMLGVPQDKLAHFVRLGDLFFSAAIHPEQGAQAADDLFDFFRNEVEKRKASPEPDLITYLANVNEDGKRLMTDDEVAVTARFVLPGGIDTTWRGLALTLATLLGHEEQFDDVCQEPKNLARKAVEEGLRFAPSGFVVPRISANDTVVAGVEVPAGSHITIYQGVANRDPRRWDEPDTYNIHRPFKSHRTFNGGTHGCAGQHLARYEILTCLELIAERMPNLRLAIPLDQIDVRGLQIRAPRNVPVKLV